MCKTDKKNSLYSDTCEVHIEIDGKREGTERLVYDLTDRLKGCFALYAPHVTCELTRKKYKRGVLSELIYTCVDKEPDNVARFAEMFDIEEWNSHPSTKYTIYPYEKYFVESISWSRDIPEGRCEIFMSSEVTDVDVFSIIRTEKYYPALYDTMRSWICIRCIVDDSSEDIIKRILYGLNILCKRIFPDIEVVCTHITDYWKVDKAQDIVFRLITDKKITLEEVCLISPLHWDLTTTRELRPDGSYQPCVTEVFWSHFCDPNEVLITPELTWIHMYEIED